MNNEFKTTTSTYGQLPLKIISKKGTIVDKSLEVEAIVDLDNGEVKLQLSEENLG